MLDRFKRSAHKWRPYKTRPPERLAGVTHKNRNGTSRQHALRQCRLGMPVDVLREPDNPADKNAVALFAGGTQIGYRPAESAPWFARALDSGEVEFTATLSDLYEFETDDKRMLVSGEVTLTEHRLARVESISWLAVAGAAASCSLNGLCVAILFVLTVVGQAIRWIDGRLFAFAQGSRLFCNVYWSLIAMAIGLAAVAARALR